MSICNISGAVVRVVASLFIITLLGACGGDDVKKISSAESPDLVATANAYTQSLITLAAVNDRWVATRKAMLSSDIDSMSEEELLVLTGQYSADAELMSTAVRDFADQYNALMQYQESSPNSGKRIVSKLTPKDVSDYYGMANDLYSAKQAIDEASASSDPKGNVKNQVYTKDPISKYIFSTATSTGAQYVAQSAIIPLIFSNPYSLAAVVTTTVIGDVVSKGVSTVWTKCEESRCEISTAIINAPGNIRLPLPEGSTDLLGAMEGSAPFISQFNTSGAGGGGGNEIPLLCRGVWRMPYNSYESGGCDFNMPDVDVNQISPGSVIVVSNPQTGQISEGPGATATSDPVPSDPASPSAYTGSISGSWSGSCTGTSVGGSLHMSVSSSGAITGSYSGDDTGSISGSVDNTGNFSSAGGSASSATWSGSFTRSGTSLSARGSWSGSGCSGSWHGSGTAGI